MNIIDTNLQGLKVLEPRVFEDGRGVFFESFNNRVFANALEINCQFVQDNHSISKKGVLRGLHYQLNYPQGKLVRVIRGKIFDVAVDIRKDSETFGKWFGIELSAENKKQIWIPEGFAHGFLALTDGAEVLYKTTDHYHPGDEYSIIWNDTDIGIEWPDIDMSPVLSDKDRDAGLFCNANIV